MNLTLHGKHYETVGIAFGTGPAWKLIREEGQPMSRESFLALPPHDQRTLTELVQRHLDALMGKPLRQGQDIPGGVGAAPIGEGVMWAGDPVGARAGSDRAEFPFKAASSRDVSAAVKVTDLAQQKVALEGVVAVGTAGTAALEIAGQAHLAQAASQVSATGTMHRPRRLQAELDGLADGLKVVRQLVEIANVASIGHNQPPEAIDPPPLNLEDIDATIKITNVYRTIVTDHAADGDQYIIDACEAVFAAFGKRLGLFLAWLKRFPERMWDAAVHKSPDWAAGGLMAAGATALVHEVIGKLLH